MPQTTIAPSITRIALASFIGTAIEFYDFYIYGMAAALVIGPVFFPGGNPTTQALSAFLTFAVAFLTRPLGATLFGHFGDRIGRKTTLVASLLVMGISTTLIGLLPGYDAIGAWAPALVVSVAFRPGHRPGWRMGRRGIVGNRERAGRQARLVRHVSPVGAARGLSLGDRQFSAAGAFSE